MEKKSSINWLDFEKIDLRVGTILEVRDFPEARNPAYQLHIDFGGEIGILKTSAQITKRYSKEDLLNRQIVAIVNFPKKQIGKFMSECLVLGAVEKEGDVVLLNSDYKVENGTSIL
jgi:tRNA-binding protein